MYDLCSSCKVEACVLVCEINDVRALFTQHWAVFQGIIIYLSNQTAKIIPLDTSSISQVYI